MPVNANSLPDYVQRWLQRRSMSEIRNLLANNTRSEIIALANLNVPENERISNSRNDSVYRGVNDMPTRRRTDDLTSTTASRAGSTSRPQRVSVEEFERNPNRWKNVIPVQSSQTGQTTMYVAEEAGNGK